MIISLIATNIISENAGSTGATNAQDKNSIKISFKKPITYKIPGLEEITGKVIKLVHCPFSN